MEHPQMKKQVRTFLGLTGYYRRFIPYYSSIAAHLTDFTRTLLPNQVVWTIDCEKSFQELKDRLYMLFTNPSQPRLQQNISPLDDVSDQSIYIGAVLSQRDEDGHDNPVAHYSWKFLPQVQKYLTIEKECLAIKLGVYTGFQSLSDWQAIYTNHLSLVWLDHLKDNNSRLTRCPSSHTVSK